MSQLWQADWVAKWAAYRPDHAALHDWQEGEVLTYHQLNERGHALAHYLHHQLGLHRGDRIAVLAENGWAYLLLFVAAQKMGFTLVPLNYRLTTAELDYLLRDADPRLLLCADSFADKLLSSSAYARIPHRHKLTAVQHWCADPTDDPLPTVMIEEDDPIFILYTSGTTGFPKGVLYTHRMLFWNSINTAMSLIINTESRTINCMPPFHTGGWNVLTTPLLHHGGYTCLLKKFDAATVLRLLATERATIFMGVPTMLKMMADQPEFAATDLSNLLYIIVGGEPMPIPLIERWHARGVPIRQGYGMTEVGPNLTSLHQDDAMRKKGSIGRPNFYVQTRIVDAQGQEVPVGESGELLLRGPMVTPGYWRNPEATQRAFADGWFRTGDRVRAEPGGYLYVVDRIKNMYISGGENVYPAEVERVLLQHGAVSEVAVIGVADERWGEAGRAFVVTNAAAATTDELLAHCRAHLAKFKVPREVIFVTALPKNDSGKIDRRQLREIMT